MINPDYFNWGQRIQEGMQQSQDNRRRNALLDLEKRQYGLQERQVGLQERKFAYEQESAARSRNGRVAGLKYAGFPPEMAEQLADDPDFPELFMEISGKGGSQAPAAQRLAQWLANESTPAERAALQYTLRANAGKLADVAGVPTVVDTNLNRMPDFDSFRQGFPSGGSNVPTMAPYQPVQQAAPQATTQAPRLSGGARPLSSLEAEVNAAATLEAEKTRAREAAQTQVKAAADVPRVESNAQDMLEILDRLEKSPGFDWVYGARSLAPTIPGTPQADAVAIWEQVQGKAFMEAFQTLKGGGQITEKEGEKATAAMTRLANRKQRPEAARQAILELRAVVRRGLERAKKAAGPQNAAGSIRKYNPATGKIE